MGESLRRGQKRREREEPLLAAPSYHPLVSSSLLPLSPSCGTLRLFVSCVLRLEFALTDRLWLVVHPFANSRWSRSLLWVEYNGWNETKPRLLLFFFLLGGRGLDKFLFFPLSLFPSLLLSFLRRRGTRLKFVWICSRDGNMVQYWAVFDQPCLKFVPKFGQLGNSFFFLSFVCLNLSGKLEQLAILLLLFFLMENRV